MQFVAETKRKSIWYGFITCIVIIDYYTSTDLLLYWLNLRWTCKSKMIALLIFRFHLVSIFFSNRFLAAFHRLSNHRNSKTKAIRHSNHTNKHRLTNKQRRTNTHTQTHTHTHTKLHYQQTSQINENIFSVQLWDYKNNIWNMDKQPEIKYLDYHQILDEMFQHHYRCWYHMELSLIIVSRKINVFFRK